MSTGGGTRAVIGALAANAGIAITKFLAFALTASPSMLAEGIHSVADSGNQVLLLIGGRRSRRAPTAQHPFGYGRERYIYAFIVAVVLFSAGGLFALFEGSHKVIHPEPIRSWRWVPILVLVVNVVLEAGSLRSAVREADRERSGTGWLAFIRRSRAPELPVLLLEDLAAMIGLALAFFGVGLTLLTGNGVWDGVGTLGIGLLLLTVAVLLAVETKSLLLGEAATPELVAAIEAAITGTPDVGRVIHLRTLHLGPEELLVAAKIAVAPQSEARQIARAIDAAELRIRQAVPIAHVVYLEPDIDRRAG